MYNRYTHFIREGLIMDIKVLENNVIDYEHDSKKNTQ